MPYSDRDAVTIDHVALTTATHPVGRIAAAAVTAVLERITVCPTEFPPGWFFGRAPSRDCPV